MQRNSSLMSYRNMTKIKLTLFLILLHFASYSLTTLGGQVMINQKNFNNFEIIAELILAPEIYAIDLEEIQIYANIGDERILLRGYELIYKLNEYTNCERSDSFVLLKMKTNFSLDGMENSMDAHCWLTVELISGKRSPIITNIEKKESPFFIFSKINRCLDKLNNSPFIISQSSFELCVERPIFISILPYDTGNLDHLVTYEFSYPLSAKNQYLDYASGYYLDQPMNVFYQPGNQYPFRKSDVDSGHLEGFNYNDDGEIIFIPLPMEDLSLDKTALTPHYKKWISLPNGDKEMVCEGIFERFLNISFCAINLPPEIIVADTLFHILGGQEITITINSFDKPFVQKPPKVTGKQDYVSLTWNRKIPNAQFYSDKKDTYFDEAIFSWKTSTTDIREEPYIFTVTANDKNCFPTLITRQDFYIYVVESLSQNEKEASPLVLYPNPNNGLLQWKEYLTDIVIFDASGKEQKRISAGMQIDVSDLAEGYYLFTAKRNGAQIKSRFCIIF